MIQIAVKSFNFRKTHRTYTVSFDDALTTASCTCPDFQRRGIVTGDACKHVELACASASIDPAILKQQTNPFIVQNIDPFNLDAEVKR